MTEQERGYARLRRRIVVVVLEATRGYNVFVERRIHVCVVNELGYCGCGLGTHAFSTGYKYIFSWSSMNHTSGQTRIINILPPKAALLVRQ